LLSHPPAAHKAVQRRHREGGCERADELADEADHLVTVRAALNGLRSAPRNQASPMEVENVSMTVTSPPASLAPERAESKVPLMLAGMESDMTEA